MSFPIRFAAVALAAFALFFILAGTAYAQTPPMQSARVVVGSGSVFVPGQGLSPEPAPPFRGPNFSLNETSQSDESTGWSNVLTPDLSYRVNSHWMADINFPWYLSLEAAVPTTVNGVTTYQQKTVYNTLGDAAASAHFDAKLSDFGYNAVFTVGMPTGNRALGISAGTTTYHFNNHFEYSMGPFTPDVELGIGNSSALANHVVRKAYTAVGTIANFQAGTNIDLPRKLSLDAEFYESMPLAALDIYGTIGHHGQSKKVLQGAGSAEDNGISAELGIPLTRKLTLAGQYNRSIIQANDIVGFSITWQFRTPAKREGGTPSSPLSQYKYLTQN